MRSWCLAIVLGLSACGGGGARAALGNSPGAGGESLAAMLTREVGAGVPVAIVPSAEGLRAVSADGARQRTLVPGPIRWAAVDARANVVWFGTPSATTIEVLDLDSPAAAPEVTTVVTDLPAATDAGAPLVTISYADPSHDGPGEQLDLGHPIVPHVVLELDVEPSLHAAGGILALWDQQEAFEGLVQEARLPGRALLATLAVRGAGRSLGSPPSSEERRVELADTSACEDLELCGRAEVITPSWWRVVTSHSCGDGCYLVWQLYDPAKKALLDEGWATLIADAWLAPDGSAFVSNGVVIRFDRGPLASTPLTTSAAPDGNPLGGGWLGGGTYLR